MPKRGHAEKSTCWKDHMQKRAHFGKTTIKLLVQCTVLRLVHTVPSEGRLRWHWWWKSSHYTVVAVPRDAAFFFFLYYQAQNTSIDTALYCRAQNTSLYYERYFLASGCVCSTRGTATTSESSSTVKANAIRLQKAQYVLSVVAHSGSKWLKSAEKKFPRCYFTNFSKQVFYGFT